jgi:hypothetical protein
MSSAHAETFPFVLPWDDATPSVTDMSGLIEKPAGKHGFVTVKDGHLYTGNKRFRIFGVNMCFGGNFPSKDDAPKIAARMAKFGINCVRFHHMDMQTTPGGIFAKDGRTLDPEQLDKLDWFIAKLKEHGIYSDLNLHVSRTYSDRPKAEKEGNPNYDKGVDNFAASMIQLQKDFARDLLTQVNSYTGNAYVSEPAIALIEINNENALLFEWWTGGLDKIAEPYRRELSELWTKWLQKTYGSDDSIAAAWGKGAREGGGELLKNGSFASMENWHLEKQGGSEAVAEVGESGARQRVKVSVAKPGQENWHVQLTHPGLKLTAGEPYTLTFEARADAERTISTTASQAHAPWAVLGTKQVKVTTEWTKQRFSFEPKQSDDNARIVFGGLGTQIGTVEIANVSLTTSRIRGDLQRSDNQLIPAFTRDESAERTETAQRDWYKFLWELEERYWPGMAEFLRTELKAKSLILGTQLFWSPFPIQAKLDVIDSHAYWQHPNFPGRDWDMSNWTIKNIPMAGEANGGTLPRLALQRVEGKPYIVSEYNHSAPNTFSSETFPLVCAYGALQDWDGIFAFAYSHRTNDWDKGVFTSFFDIDQHPTKMATLPASVALWLRGDVSAARSASIASPTFDQAFEQARRGGPRIGAEHFGVKPMESMMRRVGVRLGDGPAKEANPAPGEKAITSDTKELVWNSEPKNGVVTIDSAKSKGVIGFVRGRSFALGDVKITPGMTRQDWATVQVTVLDGADFATAKKILITATGYAENEGLKWTNEEMISVGRNWGKRPSLVEGVPARIELPGSGKLRAWALDERGQRRAEVSVEGSTIAIGPDHRTLWYEIVRE